MIRTVFFSLLIAIAVASGLRLLYGPTQNKHQQLVAVFPSPTYSCNAHEDDFVEAVFSVQNLSTTPVKVLGAITNCGCTVAKADFPFEIAPSASHDITLSVHVGSGDADGKFKKSAKILIDRKGAVPLLTVDVTLVKT